MSKINKAIHEIESLNEIAIQDKWINNINPTVKLFVTVLYLCLVVSFDKYNITGLLSMAVFPIFLSFAGDISIKDALYRLRIVLPIVFVMGIFNPIFDREIAGTLFGHPVSGGILSMITLILKGILTVFGTYIFIASTSVEKICYSLKRLHMPDIMVTQILLTFRYITVLLDEVKRMTQAYSLRAPGQKGVHFKAWGSFAGNLLIRTADRAQDIYDSMCLRGYQSKYFINEKSKFKTSDFFFLLIGSSLMICFKLFPIFTLLGTLVMRVSK